MASALPFPNLRMFAKLVFMHEDNHSAYATAIWDWHGFFKQISLAALLSMLSMIISSGSVLMISLSLVS